MNSKSTLDTIRILKEQLILSLEFTFVQLSIKTKRRLYRALCAKLEKYHSILDPCGFKALNSGRCRHGISCCHSGGTCEYLSDSGCTVHSLSCLLWLCQDAIDYLTQIASAPSEPLHLQAKAYLNLRPHFVNIAEHYIPLQQRASENDTFHHSKEDDQLASIPEWYDDWGDILWDDYDLFS